MFKVDAGRDSATVVSYLSDVVPKYEPDREIKLDKWLARSGLQKAIRRGDTQIAWQCAKALHTADTDYCWRTLAVVAIEDIGMGDTALVALTQYATRKAVRQLAGTSLLPKLVWALATAPTKSQACCELSLALERTGDDQYKAAAKMSSDALVTAVFEGSFDESYFALSTLKGMVPRRLNGSKRAPDVVGLEKVLHQFESSFPSGMTDEVFGWPGLASAVAMSVTTPVDSMSLSLLPLWLHWDEFEEEVFCRPDTMPTGIKIFGLPGEAYDMHTGVGKMSLKAFHTSLSKKYPEIAAIPKDVCVEALGAVVFCEEGGKLSNRLVSPLLSQLKERQESVFCLSSGVPKSLYGDVRKIVRSEFDRLNQKREWALGL